MNDIITTTVPMPKVEATFHVEPHSNPIVQAFIDLVSELRKENEQLKEQLYILGKGP
jgi:hypothetical protein